MSVFVDTDAERHEKADRSAEVALGASLMLLPFALGAFAASAAWAASGRRAGRAPLATGTLTMAAGIALLLVVLRYSGDAFGVAGMVMSLAIAGLGMGLFVVNMFDAALSDVPMVDAGAASGLLHAKQQLGNTFGVALVGAIFFGTLSADAAYGPAIERALWFETVLYLGCSVLALMVTTGARDARKGR